jgi:hypothetical protein
MKKRTVFRFTIRKAIRPTMIREDIIPGMGCVPIKPDSRP